MPCGVICTDNSKLGSHSTQNWAGLQIFHFEPNPCSILLFPVFFLDILVAWTQVSGLKKCTRPHTCRREGVIKRLCWCSQCRCSWPNEHPKHSQFSPLIPCSYTHSQVMGRKEVERWWIKAYSLWSASNKALKSSRLVSSALLCSLVRSTPRFHQTHLKHIRLLEHCQGERSSSV